MYCINQKVFIFIDFKNTASLRKLYLIYIKLKSKGVVKQSKLSSAVT